MGRPSPLHRPPELLRLAASIFDNRAAIIIFVLHLSPGQRFTVRRGLEYAIF
jgi:hypothetical protein